MTTHAPGVIALDVRSRDSNVKFIRNAVPMSWAGKFRSELLERFRCLKVVFSPSDFESRHAELSEELLLNAPIKFCERFKL